MKLYSIQPSSFVDTLMRVGHIVADPFLSCGYKEDIHNGVDFSFREAYDWMSHQMFLRNIHPSFDASIPLWAWTDIERARWHFADFLEGKIIDTNEDTQRAILIHLEIDERRVLQSDYDLWHLVLNHCKDVDWEIVFDLEFRDDGWWRGNEPPTVQACLWEFYEQDVIHLEF